MGNRLVRARSAARGTGLGLIGLVALAVIGVMFATGRMNWISAVSVVVGLAIVFGAGTILSGYA